MRYSDVGDCVFRQGRVRPPTEVIVVFIDEHRHRLGIEPTCRALQYYLDISIAPPTYYACTKRSPRARAPRDAVLRELIVTINAHLRKKVYGVRKIFAERRTG